MQNASIESISVEQASETEVYYTLHFADGTTLDSPTITLPRGEKGDKGDTGATGNGIASIKKTGTSGNIDAYTITFTDGSHFYFNIENGNGIASIEKAYTSGLTDVYTITFTNGTITQYSVTNGRDGIDGTNGTNGTNGVDGVGIVSIAKTSTSGLVDTYTITLTNGTTTTFDVTNGRDGTNGTNGTNGVDGVGISSITSSQSGNVVTLTITYSDSTTQTITFNSGSGGGGGTILNATFNDFPSAVNWLASNYNKVTSVELMATGDPLAIYFHDVTLDGNATITSANRDVDNTIKLIGIYKGIEDVYGYPVHVLEFTTNILVTVNEEGTPMTINVYLCNIEPVGENPTRLFGTGMKTQINQYESNPIKIRWSNNEDIMTCAQHYGNTIDDIIKRFKFYYMG